MILAANPLPFALVQNPGLERWVRIDAGGSVAIGTGKVEIGQGITSALAQIAADELDVAYSRVRMVPANTGESPDEGVTAGSLSVEHSGGALRQACAEVRYELLKVASELLNIPQSNLLVEDGTVRAPTGEHITYWELACKANLVREANGCARPKLAKDLRLVGKPLPRIDILEKISGAAYVQDLELPGMLHGRVARPPSYRATLLSIDTTPVDSMPGVKAVVRAGRFLGVVASREEWAIDAMQSLAKSAQWTEQADLPDVDALPEFLLSTTQHTETLVAKGRIVPDSLALSAVYSRPYLSHGSIGPSCALACWRHEKLEVWTHSQSIHPLRRDLSTALGVSMENITLRHMEGAGCYGHNGADDVAMDAALLARAVPGHPVRVQWTREDEFGWEPLGPAMAAKLEGSIGIDGKINSWRHELWSNRHIMRPGRDANPSLLAAWHLDTGFQPPPPSDTEFAKGGTSQRNVIPQYDFANVEIVHHVLDAIPLRTSTIRSIGGYLNVFAIESFMDELAREAGADPVEFRLRHLSEPRARAVIEKAAKVAGWEAPMESPGRDSVRGRGIGFARYKNTGAIAAVIAEVEIGEAVRLLRFVAVLDCGRIINPDGVANQVEGGIVQAASWTLKEEVRFDRTRITSRSWDDYPILSFSEVPPVQVVLIDRPDEPSVGVGEALSGPTAAAIANAVDAALGERVRDLPITRERLVALINR